MTIPEEMFNSIRSARMFMVALLDPALTPKVPKEIRQRASDRLKHFPSDYEINNLQGMFNNSHKDKGIIIGETNKELNRVGNEIMIAQNSLKQMAAALQEFVNKG